MTIRGPLLAILGVILFLSLAANLVIAGFAGARMFGPRPGGDIERIVAIGVRAFPPEIQREIEAGSRLKRGEMRTRLDAVQAARRQMFVAMRAEPFDSAALDAAYADLRSKTSDLQQVGQSIVFDAIAKASPEVRKRIRPPRGPFP